MLSDERDRQRLREKEERERERERERDGFVGLREGLVLPTGS
jgi:hypothetical protein